MLRPFDNMMDAMWNEVNSWTRLTDIPTNVREDDKGYTIELAVPGLERKNFHMKVHDGVLDLRIRKGHRFCWPWQHNHTYIRSERKLKSAGLDGYFATIILSEDAGVNKPHKEFFDYALAKTGAQRATTIMIGDHYDTDIAGAINAGLDTIFFNRWNVDPSTLERQPDYIVNSLSEIEKIL